MAMVSYQNIPCKQPYPLSFFSALKKGWREATGVSRKTRELAIEKKEK